MDAGGIPDVGRMARGDGRRLARGSENVLLATPRADADNSAAPREAGPLDHLVAVAGERRGGEVRVAVDEVWNAVVLRGHRRSIQRSTGLAT